MIPGTIKQQRPLLWTCLFFTTFGLLCSLIAFVLPFWYARYPQSKNRFVRLGLWEICFEDFMPPDLGNLMYNGCFYLYDVKIRVLWSLIFRTWFVVCQAFHTCSFITYVLAEVVLLTQVCNLVSSRGPRAVLFCIIASGATCLFVFIGSVTMGTGVDAESKRKQAADQNWLSSLDQCSLSWAYGIAVLSLLGCIIPFVILCWCVYPKRSVGGLLSVSAWDWPTKNDLICRYHVNDLRNISSRSHSLRSRSTTSGTIHHYEPSSWSGQHVRIAPTPTQDGLVSVRHISHQSAVVGATSSISSEPRPRRSHSSSRRKPRYVSDRSPPQTSWEANGKPSSYDPRSPDTISLLSYEQPMVSARPSFRSPPNTVSEQSSIVTQESSTKTYRLTSRSHSGVPAQEDRKELCGSEPPAELSAATLTLEGPMESVPLYGQHAKPRSSASAADTSTWTGDSSIQAARPMRRSHSKSAIKQLASHPASPTASERMWDQTTSEEPTSQQTIQAAKPMRRKYN